MATPPTAIDRTQSAILTLPFDVKQTPFQTTESAIARSISRWAWFTEAQLQNAALGTLSHLPVEIRWMIWREVVPSHANGHAFSTWWSESKREVVVVDDLPPDENQHIPNLRSALPLVGLEIDQMLLLTTPYRLGSLSEPPPPRLSLERRIAPWLIPCIRHLSIGLHLKVMLLPDDVKDPSGDWINLFRNDEDLLPPTLATVTLDRGQQHRQEHHDDCEDMDSTCCRRCWPRLDEAMEVGEKGRCHKHAPKVDFAKKTFQRELAVLEVVTKIVARGAPEVVIRLGDETAKCGWCYERYQVILDEIDR